MEDESLVGLDVVVEVPADEEGAQVVVEVEGGGPLAQQRITAEPLV